MVYFWIQMGSYIFVCFFGFIKNLSIECLLECQKTFVKICSAICLKTEINFFTNYLVEGRHDFLHSGQKNKNWAFIGITFDDVNQSCFDQIVIDLLEVHRRESLANFVAEFRISEKNLFRRNLLVKFIVFGRSTTALKQIQYKCTAL